MVYARGSNEQGVKREGKGERDGIGIVQSS
jgi:hypothetical protein